MGAATPEFDVHLVAASENTQKWDQLVTQTMREEQTEEEKRKRRQQKLMRSAENVPELVLQRSKPKVERLNVQVTQTMQREAPEYESSRTLRSNHSSQFHCYGDRVQTLTTPIFPNSEK